MGSQIEGKVAAIIDDTTLVLNIGSEQGVAEGTAFAIFATHGQIADPDSGELLGLWEMVKAQVVVTHVQPRICTVRAPVVDEVQMVGDTRPLSSMMVEHSVTSAKAEEEWKRLQVRGSDISGRPQSQPIAVGDGARSLVDAVVESTSVADAAQTDESEAVADAAPTEESGEAEDADSV